MPVGRVSYKGPIAVGRTNPVAMGTLALRGMAKAGLGGKAGSVAKLPSPVAQQQEDLAMAKALGLPGAKGAKLKSQGRQNVPVKKAAVVASSDIRNTGSVPTRVPKSRPNSTRSGKQIAALGKAGKSLRSQPKG